MVQIQLSVLLIYLIQNKILVDYYEGCETSFQKKGLSKFKEEFKGAVADAAPAAPAAPAAAAAPAAPPVPTAPAPIAPPV